MRDRRDVPPDGGRSACPGLFVDETSNCLGRSWQTDEISLDAPASKHSRVGAKRPDSAIGVCPLSAARIAAESLLHACG
jgi:hypothetical protein